MKHLLIPTDFSIQSLNAVYAAIAKYGDTQLKITLFHLLAPSHDITDILFAYKRSKPHDAINENFKEAYQILQNRYNSRIHSITVKFGYGNTAAYLKNLLEGEKVDHVIFMADSVLQLPMAKSIEMLPLFRKTGFPLDVISAKSKKDVDISAISMMNRNEIKPFKTEKSYVTEK
ncbi:MAG TPA: hypothetical protein VGD89_13185 [Flavipsychrobacter sp.]